METKRRTELAGWYRRALLDDVVPFWLRHSLDREYGGYLTCLDRDGSVYGTDKAMWLQAREVWLFATLYNTLEPRPEWLEAARLGYRFLREHGYDADGRMFFATTREGRPLRKRRYLFTETFGAIAGAQYAVAADDEAAWDLALRTYRLVVDLYRDPASHPELAATLAPKTIPGTRRTKSHAMPMIVVATSQEMRRASGDASYTAVIDEAIDEILTHFCHRDERALLETVGPHGERLDAPEGRVVNPGHAIESAWFMLREARYRGDRGLQQRALEVLDWSLEWGWDEPRGGLLYFVDIEGRPPEQLEWDMKLWWPHTEALYALLLAHELTGEGRYLAWHDRVHAWSVAHLTDPAYGEWYGYLHRDGSVALPAKGSMWKGAFHVPRSLLYCMQLLEAPAPEVGPATLPTIP